MLFDHVRDSVMLAQEVVHLCACEKFGNVLLKQFFKQLFRLLLAKTLRNFDFFFLFSFFLFFLIFFFLDSILDPHIIQLQVDNTINQFFQVILNLRSQLILGQLRVIIFCSHLSLVSASPYLCIFLDALLKSNNLLCRTNFNMLVQELIDFVLLALASFLLLFFVLWLLVLLLFIFLWLFLLVKIFSI